MKHLFGASLYGLALLAATGAARASSLDLNLSGDAARLGFASTVTKTGLEADFGYLYHEDDREVAALGLHLVDDAAQGGDPFRVGLGARAVFVDAGTLSGGALAVGGHFRYIVPRYNRFGIGGAVYYAPDVVSFGDQQKYLELMLRGEYQVLRRASAYVGFRGVRAQFDGTRTRSLDSGLHAGLYIEF